MGLAFFSLAFGKRKKGREEKFSRLRRENQNSDFEFVAVIKILFESSPKAMTFSLLFDFETEGFKIKKPKHRIKTIG